MAHVSLYEFIGVYREDIIRRCRAKVAKRSMPPPTEAEINHGVPLFLDQLVDALRLGLMSNPEIGRSAIQHGHELLLQGFTVSQVVLDYGDVCQSVTDLAVEMDAPISTDDFRTLNRCLDDAIAGAVTEYGHERDQSTRDGASARGSERLGFLAHEVRNLTNTAIARVRRAQDRERGSRREHRGRAPAQPHGHPGPRRSIARRGPPQPSASRIVSNSWSHGFIDELAAAATFEANAQGHHAHRDARRGWRGDRR